MAGAQADCGGVRQTRAGFSSEVLAFASRLLSFAEREYAQLPVRRTLALPGRVLAAAFSAPGYAELCDRAFLPPASRSGEGSAGCRPVRLAVIDRESLPGTPHWEGPAPGLHEVATALAAHGLWGACDPDHHTWDIYDPVRALGVRAMRAVALRPPWEASFPLRLLLHRAARAVQRGMVHAGTLGHDGCGVFIVGAGGAGKSGTTLSGILSGLTSVGDDYVAVSARDGAVEARPVLRLMKQDIRGLHRLGLRAGEGALAGRPNWQGKIEFDYEALVPGARAERLAITAIVMPRIAGAASSSFRPAGAREAMLAMAPSSLYQLHGSWREDFALIASVVRALPAFHLELSQDPAEIAAAVRALIEGAAG